MDPRIRQTLIIGSVAITAYALGYNKATSHFIQQYGVAMSKEAMQYLAARDILRNRGF